MYTVAIIIMYGSNPSDKICVLKHFEHLIK